jgi:hypothetical protein
MMQLRLFVLTGLFIMACALPAAAQSYAPTKAGLRQLVHDDEAMLPPPYAAKLRKQEADWERGVGVTCTRTKWCYPDAGAMINSIQSDVFKTDGFVFFTETWSTSFPLPAETIQEIGPNSAGLSTPIKLGQDIPQIVTPLTPQSRAFNTGMENFAQSVWSQQGGPPLSTPHDDKSDDFYFGCDLNTNALPGLFSFTCFFDNYHHGNIHATGRPHDFNWNIQSERQVTPDDIFAPGTGWQSAVAKAAISAFTRAGKIQPGFLMPQLMPQVNAWLSNPSGWDLLREGLKIDTGDYEICPYTCDAPSTIIPWSVLKPYLKPGGLVQSD